MTKTEVGRRVAFLLVASLAVGSVLLASLLSVPAMAADPVKKSNPGTDGRATEGQEAMEKGGEQLRAAAQAAGALDVYWDESGYVVVAPAGSAVDPAAWAGMQAGATVRIQQASVTAADIEAVKARVAQIAATRPGQNDGWVVYLDLPTGVITVEGPASASLERALTTEFGPKITYVLSKSRVERIFDRNTDVQPFWGGDRITDNWIFPDQGTQCTSGFAVRNAAGTRYMTTAGHCKELGAGFWTMGREVYGHVRALAPFPATDAEMIGDETYAARIWTGGLCCNSNPVTSGGNPFVNSTYCGSGSFSFEHCDHTALAVDVQFCDEQNLCTDHTVRFNGTALQHGDSGGPFYFKSSQGCIAARGLLIGWDPAIQRGWAQMWNTVLNKLNVSTVTGAC